MVKPGVQSVQVVVDRTNTDAKLKITYYFRSSLRETHRRSRGYHAHHQRHADPGLKATMIDVGVLVLNRHHRGAAVPV